jgi:hypothetical protein
MTGGKAWKIVELENTTAGKEVRRLESVANRQECDLGVGERF